MKFRSLLACLLLSLPLLLSAAPKAERADFAAFLDSLAPQVSAQGIAADWYENIKDQIEFLPDVIVIDRLQGKKPPLPYNESMKRWLAVSGHPNETRITLGKKLLAKHRTVLDQVEQKYKVDRTVIVALWGVETQYGNYMGKHRILDALATLAFEGRRRQFFTEEFLGALNILQEGHASHTGFVGSWAGAMGQCQFMPTSFYSYAVDFDNDGKKDIWSNHADIFASIGNYLKSNGWQWKKPLASPQPDTTGAPKEIRLLADGSPVIYADVNYPPIFHWNASHEFVYKVFYLKNQFDRDTIH